MMIRRDRTGGELAHWANDRILCYFGSTADPGILVYGAAALRAHCRPHVRAGKAYRVLELADNDPKTAMSVETATIDAFQDPGLRSERKHSQEGSPSLSSGGGGQCHRSSPLQTQAG